MNERPALLLGFYQRFKELDILLKSILRKEEILEENVLVKSGFLLRRYSLRPEFLKLDELKKLKKELERTAAIEAEIIYQIHKVKKNLQDLERDFYSYTGEKLHLKKVFTQSMNNAFQMSKSACVRVDQLLALLQERFQFNKKTLGIKGGRLLISLEKMTNQIVQFIDLLEQLSIKVAKFEQESYYPSPLLYGRAMSKKESRQTRAKEELIGSPKRKEGDIIGVFDCPLSLRNRLLSLSEDERKNFFGQIGVAGGIKILFFQTTLKPKAGPIIQSNGLREYKFPKRTHIEILEAA